MRLKQIVLASMFSAFMALPAMAQTTPPAATAPATTAPAKPAAPAATTAAKPAKVVAPVSVNTGTAAQLDTLPGIGKARSAAIIKGRPYKSVDEVDTKKVIPHAVYEKIKGSLTL